MLVCTKDSGGFVFEQILNTEKWFKKMEPFKS